MSSDFDTTRIEIPIEVQESWQKSVDLIARIAKVPAALVMRAHAEEIEVMVSSQSEGNPYEKGEKVRLETGIYCGTVMRRRDRLLVPNALIDPDWGDNPGVELDMISYMGWPVLWPDGQVFGTICVLDRKPNEYGETESDLLYQFKQLVEFSLRSIYEQHQLDELKGSASHLEEERRAYKKLAATDALTGTYNRRAFMDLAKRLFERLQRWGANIAILIVDVDHFKRINDRHGHQAGDAALVQISGLLKEQTRRVDLLGRYGGDEFVLLAPEISLEAARAFAARLVAAAQVEPLRLGVGEYPWTLSVGAYCSHPEDRDVREVIRRADMALLAAKRAGRDRATLWEPGLESEETS